MKCKWKIATYTYMSDKIGSNEEVFSPNATYYTCISVHTHGCKFDSEITV